MIRKEAVKIVAKSAGKNPIVSANGFMSRDLFEMNDKKSNFYMIGSMGLASSIGLGIALKNPKKQIFVFDGDGNILMNLGSLVTIGSLMPKNLVHVVFDNNSHESTGGQPTNSSKISLEKIANSVNYKIFVIKSKTRLISVLDQIKKQDGPIFLLIKISTSKERSKRVLWKPKTIRDRVVNSL
ncbi:sulfopyruvate decarboxylase subunit beta [Nitrosopumilus sp. b3]|uniref:thiamine pyrophosphate-dependent enzyme n=1 Tax=Nitrosopumilus sp. b3 TaxID=2109909 RepID=UPI0015F65862|nr:thiamine pyrophosphate-dependent enzyme [Nitrosopumilus sp. b3]KAF6246750.1 sulfopyruvate decarboxylase subunit beta [Nitrosopumilus sp. b3]